MATTTEVPAGVQMIDVERIAIPGNVRELDGDHVDALAGSIKLRGLRVPVIVRPDEKGYELVAGFHRFAAHKKLGLTQIRAEIQADADAHVDRGLENIARKQLNAYEEAQAVRAMLADGLVDELHLFVYPVARGEGERLLADGYSVLVTYDPVAGRPIAVPQPLRERLLADGAIQR